MGTHKRGRRASSKRINSDRLRYLLEQKDHMTISQLAKSIGYDRSGVSTSINRSYMDVQMIIAIGKALDVDPRVLLEDYAGSLDDIILNLS